MLPAMSDLQREIDEAHECFERIIKCSLEPDKVYIHASRGLAALKKIDEERRLRQSAEERAEKAEAREAALMREAMIEESEPPYRIEFIIRWRAALQQEPEPEQEQKP